MIINQKILIASNAKKHHEIYDLISVSLCGIDLIQYIKIYNGKIKASNILSQNGKNEPVVTIGDPNIVGLELLIDVPTRVVQFYAITSSTEGYGDKMVSSVASSVPDDWKLIVLMDWSQGFWKVMEQRYPRLIVS